MFEDNPLHTGVQPNDPTIGASSAAHLQVKWKSHATAFDDVWSSSAVAFNAQLDATLVYTATSAGTIAARDLNTGTVIWSDPGNGAIVASPAVSGNTVYVGSEGHQLLALDAATGARQCSFSLDGAIFSSPVVGFVDDTGPVVFFGDTGTSEDSAGHEWAINGVGNADGACTRRWVFNSWTMKGSGVLATGSWSSPALTTDSAGQTLLIFGSANPDDAVYALDAQDGTLVWRFQTTVTGSDQDVGAAPTISPPGVNGFPDGVVYVDGKDMIEYALDLGTGTKIWSFNLHKATGGENANCQSATALIGNRIVVPYARYVFKLDADTGRQIWRSLPAPSIYYASPAISGASSNQVIFIGDADGIEHAYRLQDGAQMFQLKTGGSIYATAAIADGTVIFGADTGYLYALSEPTT